MGSSSLLFLFFVVSNSVFADKEMECWSGYKSDATEAVPSSAMFCPPGINWCQIKTRFGGENDEHVYSSYDCSEKPDDEIPSAECDVVEEDDDGDELHVCYFRGEDSNGGDLFCRCDRRYLASRAEGDDDDDNADVIQRADDNSGKSKVQIDFVSTFIFILFLIILGLSK